nr:zinc finger, CCHC-type [Tanacetum cinerariifolium]
MVTTSSANNSVFRGFFEKQKLIGPNFIDWYRQLRIVLSIEDKLNYLEQPDPPAPIVPAGQHVAPEILAAHTAWIKGSKEIVGLMLMTMEPEIQRNLETLHAHEMLLELKTLFSQQAEQELLQTTRDFHSCKQEEGQSVSFYVLKMKGYIDNLECLGHPVTLGLGVSIILISLRKEFDGFVQNYNMHSLGKTINKLHAMLKLHEQTLPKNNAPDLHAIRSGKEVENQLGKTIKSLCLDRGGEYMSQEFLDHLKDHEIIAHRTPLYTPQYNGVSEWRNRTLLDMVQPMMSQTTLPKSFWDYALETATRILNMVPTKKVVKTPYDIWHGKAPKLSYLKVWGCEALIKRDTLTKPDKLEPRSIKCIFIGYPKETIRYSFYYPPENKILVARNAKFLENSLITQEASESLKDLEIIQEKDTHPSIDTSLNHKVDDLEIDEPQSDIIPIRRSTRTRHAPDRMCLYIDADEHELTDLGEPANYKAALLDPESEK